MDKEQIEEILKKFDKTEKTLIETTNELCDLFGVSKIKPEEWEMCDNCNTVTKCLKANKCLF